MVLSLYRGGRGLKCVTLWLREVVSFNALGKTRFWKTQRAGREQCDETYTVWGRERRRCVCVRCGCRVRGILMMAVHRCCVPAWQNILYYIIYMKSKITFCCFTCSLHQLSVWVCILGWKTTMSQKLLQKQVSKRAVELCLYPCLLATRQCCSFLFPSFLLLVFFVLFQFYFILYC